MPCYATGTAEGDARLMAQEAHEQLTITTRVACELNRLLKDFYPDYLNHCSLETRLWIRVHEQVDIDRR
jgi:hypothetical protein